MAVLLKIRSKTKTKWPVSTHKWLPHKQGSSILHFASANLNDLIVKPSSCSSAWLLVLMASCCLNRTKLFRERVSECVQRMAELEAGKWDEWGRENETSGKLVRRIGHPELMPREALWAQNTTWETLDYGCLCTYAWTYVSLWVLNMSARLIFCRLQMEQQMDSWCDWFLDCKSNTWENVGNVRTAPTREEHKNVVWLLRHTVTCSGAGQSGRNLLLMVLSNQTDVP